MKRAFLCASLLGLAACNSARDTPIAVAAPPASVARDMTAVADCAGVIARYRAVAKSDADTGNVNKSVYAQIDGEIRRAEAACAAGRDAEARAQIAGSKSRHGYPSGN